MPRIVALGGGTGLPVVLRGLRHAAGADDTDAAHGAHRDRVTAIVTVADDGGSSGRLRRAYRVGAPGDLRNCLVALADGDPTMAALFNFRFAGAADVAGHSLGNLILTALAQLSGDLPRALDWAGRMLGVRGRVLPCTADDVRLAADLDDGSTVVGESRIAAARRAIRRVRLIPDDARALPEAVAAIARADLVVLGPGSLYTSVIPILLVRGIARALTGARARVVLVANLMSEPGETDGYAAVDLLDAIRAHAPEVSIGDVLLNSGAPDPAALARYAAQGSHPVAMTPGPVIDRGCRAHLRDLIARDSGGSNGTKVRHDPGQLARALISLAAPSERRPSAAAAAR